MSNTAPSNVITTAQSHQHIHRIQLVVSLLVLPNTQVVDQSINQYTIQANK